MGASGDSMSSDRLVLQNISGMERVDAADRTVCKCRARAGVSVTASTRSALNPNRWV
jgi:hypothetical protein